MHIIHLLCDESESMMDAGVVVVTIGIHIYEDVLEAIGELKGNKGHKTFLFIC